MKKLKTLWLGLFAAALCNSCATAIPNIEAVSPTGDIAGVAALGQMTNTDGHRRLSLDQWFDFLYAQPERPDPAHSGQTLPAKGPAVCVSSIDWQRNETALAQLCIHGKCTYEQQTQVARALQFRGRILRANAHRMGGDPMGLVAQNEALVAQVMAAPLVTDVVRGFIQR